MHAKTNVRVFSIYVVVNRMSFSIKNVSLELTCGMRELLVWYG